MERNRKRSQLLCVQCALLTAILAVIYTDAYRQLPLHGKRTLTVGVFSDSYWEVQNGYSYRILEDAIARFEAEHKDVSVTYVSGILKADYSEWLAQQMLLGDAPDVFFLLPDDFNEFAEIGSLKDLTPLIEADTQFEPDAYYSSAYAYGSYNETQYSLPYECARS